MAANAINTVVMLQPANKLTNTQFMHITWTTVRQMIPTDSKEFSSLL